MIGHETFVKLARTSARKAKVCSAVPREFNPVRYDIVRLSSYYRHKVFVNTLFSAISIHNNHKD